MELHELLDLISAHLDEHPGDAPRISDHAEHHGLERELEGACSVVIPDAASWWETVLREGAGKTVMCCDAPQHRCLGFTVYDLPDSETGITYWTTLASVGARLPDRVLNAISSPRGRMAVCHLISSGGAPALS